MVHPERDRIGERLGRLAGFAHALQAGGTYNGGKLVRAILDSELIRLGLVSAPVGSAAGAEAVERLTGESEAAGESVTPVAALRSAAAAARREATLPLAAAPPAGVCRVCEQLFLGEPPASCPTCEAPSTTFREHLPTWFLEPMAVADVLAALEAGPADPAMWGRVPVRSQAAYFARHEASSVAQIAAAAEGRVPGRRAGGGRLFGG